MTSLLPLLTQKHEQLQNLRPLSSQTLNNLQDWIRIELTYSSNAIEGNTLTRAETAEVLEKGINATIPAKSLKEQLEAVNHAQAIEYIKHCAAQKRSPKDINEDDIRAIHSYIMKGIDDGNAGEYRTSEIFVKGSDTEFPLPQNVPQHMTALISDWLHKQQDTHPVRLAADFHFKFVSVHPFQDGNGRTARLLMNLILLIYDYPLAIILNEERIPYIESFDYARKTSDYTPFYTIVEQSVDRSLDVYIKAAQGKPSLKTFQSIINKKPPSRITVAYDELLKIGELAKETGESISTIRYWVNEELIPVARISQKGYQLFDTDAIERAHMIRSLQKHERLRINEIRRRLQSG